MKKVKLLFYTIRDLKIVQIIYQIKKKIFKNQIKNIKYTNINTKQCMKFSIKELDLNKNYLNRFDTNLLLNNKINLLNEEHDIDLIKWKVEKASHLWNFNLHYFEYMISLASEYKLTGQKKYYEKFKELILNWMNHNKTGEGDGWEPYTISLRIPNLLIAFDIFGDIFNLDTEFKSIVITNLYSQYRFLLNNQEKHLLGNHYFENLKAIVICSMFFDENNIYKKYIIKLKKEIKEQILTDGLHYERSLMYHKIILEDIIRISYCLKQKKISNDEMINTIENMCNAMVSLEKGMGKIPLFNDAGENISKETASLHKAAKVIFNIETNITEDFPAAGYYKYYTENLAVMFDVGSIGPKYMTGHAHCDTLSFELSENNVPIFVNSGTFNYQSGLRNYFRSTEAHNTFSLKNKQQFEFWGEHRVGRKSSDVNYEKMKKGMRGSFVNYLGVKYFREMNFESDSIEIIDWISDENSNEDDVEFYLHLAPGLKFINVNSYKTRVIDLNEKIICTIIFKTKGKLEIHNSGLFSNYSSSFGILEKKEALVFKWKTVEQRMKVTIEF